MLEIQIMNSAVFKIQLTLCIISNILLQGVNFIMKRKRRSGESCLLASKEVAHKVASKEASKWVIRLYPNSPKHIQTILSYEAEVMRDEFYRTDKKFRSCIWISHQGRMTERLRPWKFWKLLFVSVSIDTLCTYTYYAYM